MADTAFKDRVIALLALGCNDLVLPLSQYPIIVFVHNAQSL
jgi:hypothetical protein